MKLSRIMIFMPFLLLVLSLALATTGAVPPTVAFGVFVSALIYGTLEWFLSLYFLLQKKKQIGLLLFAPGLLFAGGFALFILFSVNFPDLNDLTTDLNEKKEMQEKYYRNLGPKVVKADAATVYEFLQKKISENPSVKIVGAKPEQYLLEATATSPIFRFKDDFLLRVTSVPEGTRVDVRSKSRMGRKDFASNFKRILGLYDDLEKQFP